MKKILGIMTLLMCLTLPMNSTAKELDITSVTKITIKEEPIDIKLPDHKVCIPIVSIEEPEVIEESSDDIELLAWITMGEAEGESELGKRLVIDTILNRVDSSQFPNTIEEVIYQPNAFSCTQDGRLDRCSADEDVIALVYEEMANRTNSEVIFFNAGHYSLYGTPSFIEGNHYFSK